MKKILCISSVFLCCAFFALHGVTPRWEGEELVFGNKRVSCTAAGRIRISSSRGTLAEFAPPCYIINTRNKKTDWSGIKHSGGKMKRTGNGWSWELYKTSFGQTFKAASQSLILQKDGILKYSITHHPLPEGLKFRYIYTYMTLPGTLYNNRTVSFNNKEYTLHPKMKFFGEYRPKEFIFRIRDDAKSAHEMIFRAVKPHIRLVNMRYNPRSKHYLGTYLMPSKTPGVIYMDLRNSAKAVQAENVRGNIDFKALEDLEMPDDSSRNLFVNASFERGLEGYRVKHSNRDKQWFWTPFAIQQKHVYHGKNALVLEGRKTMKNEDYRALVTGVNITTHTVVLAPGSYTISFYAKRDHAVKGRLHCWIPNFHAGGGGPYLPINRKNVGRFTLTSQWKRYHVNFTLKKAQPVELHINAVSLQKENCKVYIDALQLEKGSKATAFEPAAAEGRLLTSAKDNFISARSKVQGKLLVTTALSDMEGIASIRVKNFFGKVIHREKIPFRTGKDKTSLLPLKLDSIKELGVFMIRADYALKNGKKTFTHHRYARVKFMNGTHRLKNLFSLDYGVPFYGHEYPQVLERWKKLGVGCKPQHSLRSADVYALERKYDVEPLYSSLFSYVVRRGRIQTYCIVDADRTQRVGMKDPRILIRDFHLDGNGTITKEYLARFTKAVYTVVKKYPHVNTWLLGGEIIAKFPFEYWSKEQTDVGAAKAHALLLKAFSEGVKKANPKARIIQDDPCNMRPEGGIAETERLLVECNKLGVKFDIIGIHPYRAKPEEPDLDEDAQKLFAMLDRVGYSKVDVIWPEMMHWGPFEIPQWGTKSATWTSTPTTWFGSLISYDMGKTEKKSAAWYTRSYLVALKYSDRVKTATASSTHNNCYMDTMLTPYAAQLVPNTLSDLLGDSTFKADIRFAPFIRTYVYEDAQKRPVAAVWCYDTGVEEGFKKAPEVMTDFGSSLENVFTMMNSPVPFNKGKYKYAITQFPLFFRGKRGTTQQMIRALQNTTILSGDGIAPVTAMIHPANDKQAVVYLKNLLSKPFTGTLAGRKITIVASGSGKVYLPLKKRITSKAMTRQDFDLEMKSSSGASFRFRQGFDSLAIPAVPADATFKTLDWNKLPKVPFVRKLSKPASNGVYSAGWNNKGLFIQAVVKDAVFHRAAHSRLADHWKNDCMQFFIDTMADARTKRRGYDENDYDYAVFTKGKQGAVTFRYRSVEQQLGLATQAPPDMTEAPDIPSSFSYRNGIATYRVFIPAKYLLPMRLQKGTAFGFGLYIPDFVSKGKFLGALTLSDTNGGCYNRPHTWPIVYLSE